MKDSGDDEIQVMYTNDSYSVGRQWVSSLDPVDKPSEGPEDNEDKGWIWKKFKEDEQVVVQGGGWGGEMATVTKDSDGDDVHIIYNTKTYTVHRRFVSSAELSPADDPSANLTDGD